YVNDPKFREWVATLPPDRQAAVMGAALKGDFATVEKAADAMKPKVQTGQYGQTNITYPDGSVAQVDASGTRGRWLYRAPGSKLPDDPPGLQPGGATGLFDRSAANVGGTDRFYLDPLTNVPHDVAVRALRVARGEEKPPSTRSDPNAQQINSLAAQ